MLQAARRKTDDGSLPPQHRFDPHRPDLSKFDDKSPYSITADNVMSTCGKYEVKWAVPVTGPASGDVVVEMVQGETVVDTLSSGGFTKVPLTKTKPGDPKGQLYNLSNDIGETENR